jgi:hypothetical protein
MQLQRLQLLLLVWPLALLRQLQPHHNKDKRSAGLQQQLQQGPLGAMSLISSSSSPTFLGCG